MTLVPTPPPHRQQAKMDPGPNDAGLYRSRSLQSPRWQLTKHFSWFSVLPWSKPCATKTTGKTLSAIPLHNFLAFWSCTKEASVAARSGPGDVILQGFVRVKKANQRKKCLSISVRTASSLSFWLNLMCIEYPRLRRKIPRRISREYVLTLATRALPLPIVRVAGFA